MMHSFLAGYMRGMRTGIRFFRREKGVVRSLRAGDAVFCREGRRPASLGGAAKGS